MRSYESPAYFKARRAERRLAGLCRDCPNQAHGKTQCLACRLKRAGAEWKGSDMEGYKPIEDIFAKPRVRILRSLRLFDWAEASEVLLALSVPDEDCTERNTYRKSLWTLVQGGFVEVDVTSYRINYFDKQHRLYRITRLGRDLLRRTFQDYEQRLGEGVAA